MSRPTSLNNINTIAFKPGICYAEQLVGLGPQIEAWLGVDVLLFASPLLPLRSGGSGLTAGSTRATNATTNFSISSSQVVICSW